VVWVIEDPIRLALTVGINEGHGKGIFLWIDTAVVTDCKRPFECGDVNRPPEVDNLPPFLEETGDFRLG
jgi:hypothetical protein